MRHGYADHIAAVFKDKDILDFFVLFQCTKPRRPKINQFPDVADAQLRQGDGVVGRVEDDLTLAIGLFGLIKLCCNIVRNRRILGQCRKVVVVFINGKMIRNLAGAWTKRTPVLGHLRTVLTV